jgi:superfamily I DNA/RNA helicase
MLRQDVLRELILEEDPTEEQMDAIFAEELEFLLRAFPGSGKTWVSSRRFLWRAANRNQNVGGIALLSFTNAAIREFNKATICSEFRVLLSDPNFVGTFDSFVERFIIGPFGHLFSRSEKRPRRFIAPRPGDRGNDRLHAWSENKNGKLYKIPAWEIVPFPLASGISFKKTGGGQHIPHGERALTEFFRYGFYTDEQRVYFAYRILSERPHILKCLARRFPEIIVDEAQDTNVWVFILLCLLRKEGTKVTIIGDPDQCIYEFNMADAELFSKIRETWTLPEKTLSKSFRCNDQIAEAARCIGGGGDFQGCGQGVNKTCRPFVISETRSDFCLSIEKFKQLLDHSGIPLSRSAVLCRGHAQLGKECGDRNYVKLKGITGEFAEAAFLRDGCRDFKTAFRIVEKAVRKMTKIDGFWEEMDENPESEKACKAKSAIWCFVKYTSGLPSLTENGDEWIRKLKENLENLLKHMELDFSVIRVTIKRTGLSEKEIKLPLLKLERDLIRIRRETIHQAKGESIDAILLLGSNQFYNGVVDAVESNKNKEVRRLAYVALTRARHLLLVGLPKAHFEKKADKWKEWGFELL